jgi:hypothetical protein
MVRVDLLRRRNSHGVVMVVLAPGAQKIAQRGNEAI